MTDETTLLERREELKRRLAAGKYETLVDVIVNWISRHIQELTHGQHLVSVWYSAAIIFLMTILIGFTTVVLLGESANLQRLSELFPPVLNVFGLLSAMGATASMVIANGFIGEIFTTLRESVLDVAESTTTLDEIQRWLDTVCNKRLVLIGSVSVGIVGGLYGTYLASTLAGFFVGFGLTLWTIMVAIQTTIFFAFLFFVVALSIRIRRFQLKLFTSDPSSSEVINRLSGEIGNFVFLVALYGAFLTLGGTWLDLLGSFGIVLPFLWTPTILIFGANQYSLASIIKRAKWRTLNQVQARIESLQTEESLADKETMEAIIRLLDYHDRIRATRNSALDLRVSLNFINSLLLPLLAFLLANLNEIASLFR